MDNLWINGEFKPLAGSRIALEDRSVFFGDGIYEVISAYDGAPFLLEDHLDRWEKSAEGLRLTSPYNRETRRQVIQQLIAVVGTSRVTIYGQLTRGAAKRTHQFPAIPQPSEFWFARELPPRIEANYQRGVSAITHIDERWSRCWIKSLCLLPNVLAKQAAVEAGAFEAILYRDNGVVTEGASSNFFMIRSGIIYTHPTNGRILSGCTRGCLMRLARAAGYRICETRFSVSLLREADEAFLTSTSYNVMPVTTLDGKPIGSGEVGPITRSLVELIEAEAGSRQPVQALPA